MGPDMPEVPCPCGCARLLAARVRGRARRYATRGCWARDPKNAAAVAARAAHAGARAREAHRTRAVSRADRFADKATAYTAGYRQGFMAAARWWRAKVARDVRRGQGV